MNKPLYLLFWSALIMVCFTSCVKDTDFDQADDIVITPVLELDFIYFALDENDYFNPITGEQLLTVSDTTSLNFLDGTFVQEDLKRAEFLFRFENSVNLDFITEFRFLNDNNVLKYELVIDIPAGSTTAPLLLEHIENIEDQGIIDLTRASKVVVNVTVPTSIENIEGALNLQSKTTYFLEI
ncbi:hypothetical protein ABXT64_08300 [Candidatus Marifrigoribacter sp. Uisw_064]|uniref:hypothetical protein n=1 Tax=Candidatus Marifrigoribacter sp. Uisw_064 TaxID=3230970 RepID=UPI003D4386CC